MTSTFTAAASAAGYLYQARVALAGCLRFCNTDVDVEVAIERLDDVSFEAGTALELLQTKHHIGRIGSLTDSSPDLWKTIRIWSEVVKGDQSFSERVRLQLITTGQAPLGSAASLLRPPGAYTGDARRDPKSAAAILGAIAEKSENNALTAAYKAFLDLTPSMRASLLSIVEVLDNQPLLSELGKEIEDHIRLVVPRGKAAEAREILEGWWWPTVCDALVEVPSRRITIREVEAKLDDIRDRFKRDALTTEFANANPSDAEAADYENWPFVKQLYVIGLIGPRIDFAKRDYYRAFTQRSRWLRTHSVVDGEIDTFEKSLIEEWQPRFHSMCATLTGRTTESPEVKEAGRYLYEWVENDARFPFRTQTLRFLTVGSYHILSNDVKLGWHRDYEMLHPAAPKK